MEFDTTRIFGVRQKTSDDGPVWLATDEPMNTCIRNVRIDFLQADEFCDPGEADAPVARLDGMLVLGDEIDREGEDFWMTCDSHSGELETLAALARREGLLQTLFGANPVVLLIRQLDLAGEIIDAENLDEFFDLIPRAVYLLYNTHPDLICYLVAEREGYYDEAAEAAFLDPRSVDGYSPLIYSECGFTLDKTGRMLYRVLDF